MAQYTPDGGVVPSGIPVSKRSPNEHYRLFGVYKGMIVQIIYPEDQRNFSKDRIEYVVRVKGQDYPNAVDATAMGGIFNYKTRSRKDITESSDNKVATETPREKMNGESVFVMFLEGHGDLPIIIASDQHPRHGEYKKVKKGEGLFDIEEFNGIEFSISKDSNYVIKNVGRKDDKAKVLNEDGVGSQLKLMGNGDIELNTHGTEGSSDLRAKFTKADKKMEFYAQENKVVYDSAGISIIDKNNNEFKFTSTGVTIKSVDKTSITSTGDVEVKSDAKVKVEGTGGTDVGSAASATNVNGQTVNLAGGGVPVARVGDQVIGTGNYGAPVISQIVSGSPLVTSG
jgi:hypothetical protein